MAQITTQDFSERYKIPHCYVYDAACECKSREKISEGLYSADEKEIAKSVTRLLKREIKFHCSAIIHLISYLFARKHR